MTESSDSTPARAGDARRVALACVAVATLAAIAFARTVGFGFVGWDDVDLVVENPLLRLDAESLGRVWSGAVLGLYTPLAYTLWAAVAAVAGKTPWAFHLLNVVLHAIASGLCVALLSRLLSGRGSDSRSSWPASFAATAGGAWWALHPLKVEPVAWVSGMNNLLAGVFSLAALLAMRRPGAWGEGGRAGWRRYLWATLWLVLALLSKPTSLVVPLVAAALGWGWSQATPGGSWAGRRQTQALRWGGWAVLTVAFAAVGMAAQPATDVRDVPSIGARAVVAVDAVGWYAVRTLWPGSLAIDHARRPAEVMASLAGEGDPLGVKVRLAVGAAVLLGGILALLAGWRRTGACVAVFVVSLGPVLGLRPFEFQEYSTVAERYAYLALLGPAIGAAFLSAALISRWSWRGTVPVAIGVIGFGVWSASAAGVWRDTTTLYTSFAEANPRSFLGQRFLAHLARQAGRTDEAITLYERALALRPGDFVASYNLGNLLLSIDPRRALAMYDLAAASRQPAQRARALTNRGVARQSLGDSAAARRDFEAAISADDTFAPPVANLGLLAELDGRPDEAAQLYRRALRLDPDLATAQRGLSRLSGSPRP